MRARWALGIGAALSLWGAGTLEARTWHVLADGTGDAPTVQAAIDSASHGDVVLVGPGRYLENLNLRGKRIHLKSEMGPQATILDGSGVVAPTVACRSGETNETIIEGFTITGGRGTENGRWGGGINCLDAWPVIRGNVIRGNHVESGGGGITFGDVGISGNVTIVEDNVIEENVSVRNGGGIDIGSACVIRRNVIRRNRTEEGDGGGVYQGSNDTNIHILDNVFIDNVAADKGGGLHLGTNSFFASPREIEVARNLFVGNEAHGKDVGVRIRICRGGAIFASGVFWIHHNTILFNAADTPFVSPSAAAVCLSNGDEEKLFEHNLVYGNDGGGVAGSVASGSGSAALSWNLIFNNPGGDSLSVENDFTFTLQENIFEDPLLCTDDETTDGSVAVNSPALLHPAGPIGAVAEPGCEAIVPVLPTTWGNLKIRFSSEN